MYNFADWLPINKTLYGSSSPVTYQSEGLAKSLGLENLHITFGGYWPEKGAMMKTCSFKETEGVDIQPAAAIATAALVESVKKNMIEKDATIMLNITGGGEKLFSVSTELKYLEPSLIFDIDPDASEVKEKIKSLY